MTEILPGLVNKFVGTIALMLVELGVPVSVKAEPAHLTAGLAGKLVPVTTRVKPVWPATAALGLRVVITGAGVTVAVNAADVLLET